MISTCTAVEEVRSIYKAVEVESNDNKSRDSTVVEVARDIYKAVVVESSSSRDVEWASNICMVAGWGADGIIIGSAMVKLLGEAKSPEEGLKELETFAKSLKAVLPS